MAKPFIATPKDIQDVLSQLSLSTLEFYKDRLESFAEQVIEEKLSLKRKYNSNIHRQVIKAEDLLAEDIIPCDWYYTGWWGVSKTLNRVGEATIFYYLIPTTLHALRIMIARYVPYHSKITELWQRLQ